MISINYELGVLKIAKSDGPIHRIVCLGLQRLGFEHNSEEEYYSTNVACPLALLEQVLKLLDRRELEYQLCPVLVKRLKKLHETKGQLIQANQKGNLFKNFQGDLQTVYSEFISFLQTLPRTLKPHQIKSALHMLEVGNGANFSVPGSGKTTVVLAVYEWLRRQDLVDAIFVVGPISCFEPWKNEFVEVVGRDIASVVCAGTSSDQRRKAYLGRRGMHDFELYLTSFQTLQNDYRDVASFFERMEQRVFLVLDEAHYIKRQDGAWANAALAIANSVSIRCILTGTPFPNSLTDAFNLFRFLWPTADVFDQQITNRIEYHIKRNQSELALELVDQVVSGLFYRVRKRDLGLAEQVFHEPIQCQMNPIETEIYTAITDKIASLELYPTASDTEVLNGLRRGRIMRLRQCVSNVSLLTSGISGYDEQLFEMDSKLVSLIRNYEDEEVPGKIRQLNAIVEQVMHSEGKVLIWSNFIGTIDLLEKYFLGRDLPCKKIYGATPFETDSVVEAADSREQIVREFNDKHSGLAILIANPAACAEAISLHKACSVAVYYDLSYNCAQYIQSQDRIHRVGGSENKASEYYILQYENTIEDLILDNLNRKQRAMATIIDQDYPVYELDMFLEPHLDDLEVYNAAFGNSERL